MCVAKRKPEQEMGSHQKKLVVTQTKGEILGKAFSYLRSTELETFRNEQQMI